jgi:hypothetical protein
MTLRQGRGLIMILIGFAVMRPSAAAEGQPFDCSKFPDCPSRAACNLKIIEQLRGVKTSDTTGQTIAHPNVMLQQAQQEMLRGAVGPGGCASWKEAPLRDDPETAKLLVGADWEGFQTQLEGKNPLKVVLRVAKVTGNVVEASYDGLESRGVLADGTLTLENQPPANKPNNLIYTIVLRRVGWHEISGEVLLRRPNEALVSAGLVLFSKQLKQPGSPLLLFDGGGRPIEAGSAFERRDQPGSGEAP